MTKSGRRRPGKRRLTRRSIAYLISAVAAVVLGALVVLHNVSRDPDLQIEEILAAYQEDVPYGGLTIRYPLDGTLFPPEIVAPTFRWEDDNGDSDTWLVTIKFQGNGGRMSSAWRVPVRTEPASSRHTNGVCRRDRDG